MDILHYCTSKAFIRSAHSTVLLEHVTVCRLEGTTNNMKLE